MVIWITGLSASGKTTLGKLMYEEWKQKELNTVFIDGDDVRRIFKHDANAAAYTLEERKKNADRICQLCAWLDRQGINVVCSILSIFEESRQWNRKNYSKYFEVFIDVPMEVLMRRELKGLYASAQRGEQKNVVGVDIPFSPPARPDYVFNNAEKNSDLRGIAHDILSKALRL